MCTSLESATVDGLGQSTAPLHVQSLIVQLLYNCMRISCVYESNYMHVCMDFIGLQVIVGNKEERISAGPVMQVPGLSLTAGANYGIGVVARNNIGDSKTFVGAFSVPSESSHSVHGVLM